MRVNRVLRECGCGCKQLTFFSHVRGHSSRTRPRKPRNLIVRKCLFCLQEFECWPSSNKKYCHVSCAYAAHRGSGNPNYLDGRTPLVKRLRNSPEYKSWRSEVYSRDNYTCQSCGQIGGQLNAHHIAPVAKRIDLIFDVGNGITLCEPCHELIPKRYTPDVVFMPYSLAEKLMHNSKQNFEERVVCLEKASI